jgi:hypothetical protein
MHRRTREDPCPLSSQIEDAMLLPAVSGCRVRKDKANGVAALFTNQSRDSFLLLAGDGQPELPSQHRAAQWAAKGNQPQTTDNRQAVVAQRPPQWLRLFARCAWVRLCRSFGLQKLPSLLDPAPTRAGLDRTFPASRNSQWRCSYAAIKEHGGHIPSTFRRAPTRAPIELHNRAPSTSTNCQSTTSLFAKPLSKVYCHKFQQTWKASRPEPGSGDAALRGSRASPR